MNLPRGKPRDIIRLGFYPFSRRKRGELDPAEIKILAVDPDNIRPLHNAPDHFPSLKKN
jgi:hypothetical protein